MGCAICRGAAASRRPTRGEDRSRASRHYTREYAWEKAKFSDTVTLKGDKLYIQTTGDKEPTELVPQGAHTFFVPGSLNRNAFIRDGNGKVAEIRGYSADAGEQSGYKARRIK